MREPPRYETAERLGLAPRSGFVQPFGQADALRAAPSARGLPQTLGGTQYSPCLASVITVSTGMHRSRRTHEPMLIGAADEVREECFTTVRVGCPSFGGQRTRSCPPPPPFVAAHQHARCGAVARRLERRRIFVAFVSSPAMKSPRAAQPCVPADPLRAAPSAGG